MQLKALAAEASEREEPGRAAQAQAQASSPSEAGGALPPLKKIKLAEDTVAMAPEPMAIDEDLHSRQLAVYGRETMRRLFGASVLISGINGLGVEVAKNVILAGVKAVALHDTTAVERPHLSAQFYLTEADIGRNRADASAAKLQELNTAVAVSVLTTELTAQDLGAFQAVVFTDLPLEKAIEYDKVCREHSPPVAFIRTETRGLFGSIFCDFGPAFTVADVDGEEPFTGILASVANSGPDALVTCVDDERLQFQDGDLVTFSEVRGMVELNDGKPRRVRNVRANTLVLEEDTSSYGAYEGGGIITQVKQPKVLQFKPLDQALSAPGEFLLSDFAKFDRPPLLHLAFQALDAFRAHAGHLPAPGSAEDEAELLKLVEKLNAEAASEVKQEKLDEAVLKNFAAGSSVEVNPMAAMFGGIVGQEVVKACSGKFHPLFQFFYFDSLESLPPPPLAAPKEVSPARTDAQVLLIGAELQERLANARVFMVGAGALGCEFLKNLALMGVACGPRGELVITDDDVIEKSNLSRQFLFRNWDIGQSKAAVAAAAAVRINPALKVKALQNRVSPETENVFDDAFWKSVDVVINALDNVNARLYVDARCVYFGKPLLESGTLGTKCNTQVVYPNETENYGASRDPPEKQAPMCTLHSFPHNIDHCLTWARSEFEGLLGKTPSDVNAFLESPEAWVKEALASGDAAAREALERVLDFLQGEWCATFEDCISWARNRFEDYFSNRVKQLTFTFPEDATTSSGTPFWSAPKRFPRAVEFNPNDPTAAAFVTAAAILRAETFGVQRPPWAGDAGKVAQAAGALAVPDFVPKQGVKIVTDEKATSQRVAAGDDSTVIQGLLERLKQRAKDLPDGFRAGVVQFEKDDDTNFHMDLISSLANLRARNYAIPEVDKLKAKFIAGRIIPAIATTTALATGLVCLELYKVMYGAKVDKFRNTFANLALPLFSMAEPVPPKKVKHGELTWSIWDRWIIEGDVTLKELLDWFSTKQLSAYSISCGAALLYNSIFPKHKDRMGRKVSDLAREIAKLEVPESRKHFDIVVACEDDEGEDLDVPLVSILFR